VTSLVPADVDERAGLVAHLERLVGLDDRGAVRLQGHGSVLGVWGGPPLDVVTLRPVGLAGQGADGLDVTVSVRRLLDRLVESPAAGGVDLPDAVPGPAWAGLLPPRSGWQPLATVPTSAVFDAVRLAVDGFRRRVDELPEVERSSTALEAVAAQVWARPVVAGIPLRAAHAAELTGLLGRDGEVVAYETGPWWRLACPGGSVALRRDSGSRLGLDLGVWALGQG
jgi:hypothetical protein